MRWALPFVQFTLAFTLKVVSQKFIVCLLFAAAQLTLNEDEDADTDGFVLYSQPTYERILSQLPEEEATPPQPSTVAVNSLSESQQDLGGNGLLDSNRGPEAKEQDYEDLETSGLTPAVHSADRVQLNKRDSLGHPSGIFPIFRSKKDCKILYIIRHGESEYNAACAAMGSRWEDPIIFDAPLTKKGKSQAIALREQVSAWNLPSETVWVTSPLSRAIETLLLVLQGKSTTPMPSVEEITINSSTSSTSNANLPADRIHVLADVTERFVTSGDVGRHPSDLSKKFPMLAKQFESLPLVWWYNHPDRENCCYRGLFNASEPKDEMQRRIKRFRKWMLARPEKVFVAVGHSMYWKAFATACKNGIKQDALRNCGWMVLHV